MERQLNTFTEEAARAMPGPGWMVERRGAAAARASGMPFPSVELEEWRYSPVDALDLDGFAPVLAAGDVPAGIPAGARDAKKTLPDHSVCLVLCNGRLLEVVPGPEGLPDGVFVGRLSDRPDAEELLESHEARNGDGEDLFAMLNSGFAPDPVLVEVRPGVDLAKPVLVVDWVQSAGVASFSRLLVDVGDNARVRVIEYQGGTEAGSLCVPRTSVRIGSGARGELVGVQRRPEGTWQLADIRADAAQDAAVSIVGVGLGASYARTRTHCRLAGRGASAQMTSVYYGTGDQILDYRTYQDHLAPDTSSDLLFKGVLDDDARSVYTGLIRVGKDARGTNALQTNRTLKLSDRAWAESVPNLEIENNDVRCSHASTMGPVDEDQLFYLESRGVPTNVAERLVVTGFFSELRGRLADESIEALLDGELSTRLVAREAR